MKIIALFSFTLCIVFLGNAQNTYFVSLAGDDTNNGLSESSAWRTISYSVSSASPVTAGDTIYIKAGNYGLEDVFIDKNYSPNDARISIIGYQNSPGDIISFDFNYGDDVDATLMPLINPNDRTIGEGINLSDIYSITIKNIQLTNCLSGISIWNTNSINSNHKLENIFLKDIGWEYSTALSIKEGDANVIDNCLIVNATGAGMDLWGDNNIVSNCKVYSNESQLVPDGTYTSMDYYIVLKGDGNTVSNCYAERDGDLEDVGHGFEIKESGSNNLFKNCTVKNMIAGCFSVRWAAVQYNEFRDCRAIGGVSTDVSAFMIREGASNNVFNACISENCNAGITFLLAGEDASYCGENNSFKNCIFKNAEWVLDLNPYFYNSASVDNNSLINCTIDNASYLYNCERPNIGNQIFNCIISNVSNFTTGSNVPAFTYAYCDFYSNGFAMPNGNGNISIAPLFVDQPMENYHLQSNSPCVDAGTPNNAVIIDFDGVSRPQGNGIDIGAFEYTEILNIDDFKVDKTVCYPNPTVDIIRFTTPYNSIGYQIYSASGKMLQEGIVLDHQIDLTDLNKGVYLLKMEGKETYKFVKE